MKTTAINQRHYSSPATAAISFSVSVRRPPVTIVGIPMSPRRRPVILPSKAITHSKRDRKLHHLDFKQLDSGKMSLLMLYFIKNGSLSQAQALWCEIINSSLVPTVRDISNLIDAYASVGEFDEITRVLHECSSRDFSFLPEIYSHGLSCFGRNGRLAGVETIFNEMLSRGFKIDSMTGNSVIKFYCISGSVKEMEDAYVRVKGLRILVEEEAIREMSSAYIRSGKFHRLGEFMNDLGLRRRNVGNLLWNLLLLSYAARFKMKTLQREFLRMLDAGFHPGTTTFNIRALAFARMGLFWDLHLSVEHMKHENVNPDLVTFGCVVDAYLSKRLGRNLSFVLDKMNNTDDFPVVVTDSIVFEAFGKGDFHLFAEAVLECSCKREWTYSKLIQKYLKREYRRNQIFWNY